MKFLCLPLHLRPRVQCLSKNIIFRNVLSVNQIIATRLQTANVVVNLNGRTQLQTHVDDNVISLH